MRGGSMLVQITLLYAGLLGLFLVILSFNVLQNWVRMTASGQAMDRDMRRAERVLSSFVEYVPLSLMIMYLVEQRGGVHPIILHTLGGMLLAGRVLHAWGSNEGTGSGLLRFLGAQLTFLMLMVGSLTCIYFFGLDPA